MWLVALDRCRHHILFDVQISAVMVYLQGAGMVYYQLVCAYWRMSSIKSNVSGLFVKGHCALSVGCSILYICFGSVLLGDVGCYQSAMHFYCRKQQQHLVYAHVCVYAQDVCSDVVSYVHGTA